METKLNAFFDEYEKIFNQALNDKVDVQATVSKFATCFTEASPAGIICGNNDDEFKKRIPMGYEFYKSIGTQSMRIRSKIITPIDELHSMTKVDWSASYRKKDGKEEIIDFSVFYLTQLQNGEPKIFAYITGDEQKVLKERGITG